MGLGIEDVVVDGKSGRRDVVVLMGGRDFDTVSIDGAFAQFGETTIQIEAVDQLVIDAGPGPDQVKVIDRGDYDLVVENDRDRDERDREGRERDRGQATRPRNDAPIGRDVEQFSRRFRDLRRR